MAEWTVVLVIIALVGLGAAVAKPVISLTKAITELNIIVQALDKRLDNFTENNTKAHELLFKTQREHQKQLDIHERRITVIENN